MATYPRPRGALARVKGAPVTAEEKACIAYGTYQRNDHGLTIEISGPRVTVRCQHGAVRVIVKRSDAGSFIATDLI